VTDEASEIFGEQFELDLTPVQQLVHVSERIEYDTNHGVAYLFMPRRFFCNMETTIELFTQLDPRVHTIKTFVNETADTMYKKIGNEWKAYLADQDDHISHNLLMN
jgi:hypothetical protein